MESWGVGQSGGLPGWTRDAVRAHIMERKGWKCTYQVPRKPHGVPRVFEFGETELEDDEIQVWTVRSQEPAHAGM